MKRVMMVEEGNGGDLDMVNCLMLLTKVGETKTNDHHHQLEGGGFKCKTCHRRFKSFQALGGHRASHKKLKQMMGADLSCQLPTSSSSSSLSSNTMMMKNKMHSCPVCGLEFAIGQALGGHMRKHRNSINSNGGGMVIHDDHGAVTNSTSDDDGSTRTERFNLCLDLNLMPYENDIKLNLRTPMLDCLI
ncbi:hypothetical protein PIB30_025431 [Stylosanthes scabra]|uniref:C2H2-type domain-containing protein n=1 Tax=Stylosanthes scabra TaxID=79078 RepID=A0ABU6T9Q5_9FABA|nr:hypothetical protein [Stylosanthes scabra]